MRTNLLLSLTAALLFATVPGFAQADLEASVPFDFFAGKNVLPAGTYTLDIDNSGLVWINRDDRSVRAVIGTVGVGGGGFGHDSKLVFHRYGNEYLLSELWVASRTTGRKIRRTPREGEMARNKEGVDVTILAAAR